MSEADATAMSEDMVDATVSLKRLSCWVRPAARKQHPSTCYSQRAGVWVVASSELTRRMLDKILPSILAWTILISPCLSATMETCFEVSKSQRMYTGVSLQ
jgi:hypothetical protein